MAQVMPDSDIFLLAGVALDIEGRHTLYFTNPVQQETYFKNYTIKTLTKYSYQRKDIGVIAVQADYGEVMRANYCMFKNTAYENKWFYAFVTEVEYVNNKVCLIRYSIDSMQSWLMDFQLLPCFVERQHAETDEPGDNIVPEPLELGEAVFRNYHKLLDLSDCAVIIGAMPRSTEQSYNGRYYDGVYSGVSLYGALEYYHVNSFLDGFSQRPSAVITMYNVPKAALPPSVLGSLPGYLPSGTKGHSYQIPLPDRPTTLDGYEPRNKKLLTYPYTYIHVDNGQGQSMSLRWEFFQSAYAATISTTITQPVRATFTPSGYKGGGTEFLAERLDMGGFPVCNWEYNNYAEYLANTAYPQRVSNEAATIGNLVNAAVTGNAAAGAMALINGVRENEMIRYKSSLVNNTCAGTVANGGNLIGSKRQAFYAAAASCTAQDAQRLDDFMTMFGYATNRVKVPNIHARSRYTYVKTQGCLISALCPAEDSTKIKQMFDNGVTFWVPTGAIGDYNADNAPLGNVSRETLESEVENGESR